MPGPKTNEREGTRAVLRHSRQSAYKVREVLDLVRGKDIATAREVLLFCERDAAITVGKLLNSAVANAENNDGLDPEELFVSACYADEGTTIKRWRPRARGRATRIRKRTCHITVIVSRLPDEKLARLRAKKDAELGNRRARRVAGGRGGRGGRGRRDEQAPGTAEAPVTAAAAEGAAEEAGIVDPQEAAITAADEATEVEATTEPETGTAETVEEAGIVDPQAASTEEAEQAGAEATDAPAEADTKTEEGK
jgi:large subunit ribosomal protein L22